MHASSTKALVVYHFFAHYRGAVMEELLHSPNYTFLLAGAAEDPQHSGIEPWKDADPNRFIATECRYVRGFLFQSNVLALALRPDIRAIIFLGDMHYATTWMAAALSRLTGKRVYFWTIGWLRKESGVKSWVRCLFYKLAHGLLLYGHYAKQIGVEKGFRPERLHVIYNSLDYEAQKACRERVTQPQIEATRQELFPDSPCPLLICTTRLIRKRRLDLLLEAMAILKQEGHEVNLLLVGEGPEREALERQANERRLSVHFYGACYEEQTLARLVMASNAMVAPGMVGLAAMQSLAYGTPVITHNNPDAQAPEWESVVENVTGGFFTENDSADLARVVRAWTQTVLPDARIRQNCYRIMDTFYNPVYQREAIERALRGEPADDTRWHEETAQLSAEREKLAL